MSRRSVQFFDHTGFQQGQVSGMAFGQDRSIVLVGFAAILWLVIREEVPANQRDMVSLLLGDRDGVERRCLLGSGRRAGRCRRMLRWRGLVLSGNPLPQTDC